MMKRMTLGERMRNQETMEPDIGGWVPLPLIVHDHSTNPLGGQNLRDILELQFDTAIELIIDAAGAVTRTQVYHKIDTNGDIASDNLDTINGGVEGDLLIIRPENATRTVVVRTGVGNIVLIGGANVILDDATDHLALLYDGAQWNDLSGVDVSSLIAEGPDINLVTAAGVTAVGRGGDTVLLFDSGGNPLAEFAATSAGLDAASAAAAARDVVWIPAVTIANNHVFTAGVRYIGISRWASILTGEVTLGIETTLETCTVSRVVNDGNDLQGVIAPASGTGWIRDCDVLCDQNGAGNAYALVVDNDGDIATWMCRVEADSAAGNGYAGYLPGATAGSCYMFGGRAMGSTDIFNV